MLPVPSVAAIDETTYVLGPGDWLFVYLDVPVPVAIETAVVSHQGLVYLGSPLGSIDVRGLTIAQFRAALAERARQYYVEPKIQAHLRRVRTFVVPLTGRVAFPNEYIVPKTTRLLQLIAHAGGIERTGSPRHVIVTRADGTRLDLDYRRLAVEGVMDENIELEAGDQVFIPPRGPTFVVDGAVNDSGDYEFRAGETVVDAIRLAGGFTSAAVPAAALLLRQQGDRYIQVAADFSGIFGADAAVPPIPLEPGDRIEVPAATDIQAPVEVTGEVKEPGTYFVGAGTRLSQVLIRAGGPTPESALQRVQITRTTPEGERRVLFADLRQAEAEPALDPPLQAGDVVDVPSYAQIAGRILASGLFVGRGIIDIRQPSGETETPKAAGDRLPRDEETLGNVNGQYLLRENETLLTFLKATGGLLPTADPTRIIIERPRPDGKIDKMEFDLLRIQAGEQEDPLLRAGDRLVAVDRYLFQPRILVRGHFQAVSRDGGSLPTTGDTAIRPTAQPGEAAQVPQQDYFIAPGETLTQVVRRLGGVSPEGDPRYLRVERLINGSYTLIPVDYPAALAGESPDLVMQNGDVLEAPNRELYKDQITLAGEFVGSGVFVQAAALAGGTGATQGAPPGALPPSPEMPRGKYRIRSGEKVLDIVSETGGLTAHAAAHMAFIGRPKPDGSTEKITVDLVKLIVFGDENQNIELKNGDEFVVPRITDQVYVVGEVHAPGAFPFQEDRYVRDYIAVAGGPTDRTLTREGWVVRQIAEGGTQVVPINLGAAIQNADPQSNIKIQPGDMIVVSRENFVMKKDFPNLVPSLAVLGSLLLGL